MRVTFVDHATSQLLWAGEMGSVPDRGEWVVLPGPLEASLSCGCVQRVAPQVELDMELPCGDHGSQLVELVRAVNVEWLIGRRAFIPGEEACLCRCVPADVVEEANAQENAERERVRRLFVANGSN